MGLYDKWKAGVNGVFKIPTVAINVAEGALNLPPKAIKGVVKGTVNTTRSAISTVLDTAGYIGEKGFDEIFLKPSKFVGNVGRVVAKSVEGAGSTILTADLTYLKNAFNEINNKKVADDIIESFPIAGVPASMIVNKTRSLVGKVLGSGVSLNQPLTSTV